MSQPTFTAWSRGKWLRIAGRVGWIASIPVWTVQLLLQLRYPMEGWLYDWHVYAAAAADLLEGTLYKAGLVSVFPLPVESFNYPPLAALAVVPLLPLPDQLAGTVWVVLNIGAVAATAVFLAKCLGVRSAASWAGIAFAAYSIHPWAWLAVLGNNSPIVLLIVTAFVHEYLRGRSGTAGVVLGIAIGMKIWPVALVPLLIREARWRTLAWTMGVLAAIAVVSVLWLGPSVIGASFSALQARDEVKPGQVVLGVTWLRETFEWWPAWSGYALAAVLIGVPARGRTGVGLGILAGLAVVPNLWGHYLPAIVVGLVLIASGIAASRRPLRSEPADVAHTPYLLWPPSARSGPSSIHERGVWQEQR